MMGQTGGMGTIPTLLQCQLLLVQEDGQAILSNQANTKAVT
jgi:hypothetical protein